MFDEPFCQETEDVDYYLYNSPSFDSLDEAVRVTSSPADVSDQSASDLVSREEDVSSSSSTGLLLVLMLVVITAVIVLGGVYFYKKKMQPPKHDAVSLTRVS